MVLIILTDGRRVSASECLEAQNAIGAISDPPIFYCDKYGWHLECLCCEAIGEHQWSPSGYGVDPDGGVFSCEPCDGKGLFKIETP